MITMKSGLLLIVVLFGCTPRDAQLHACNAKIDAAYISEALFLCEDKTLDECEGPELKRLRARTMKTREEC